MPRRVSLPGASELFRTTTEAGSPAQTTGGRTRPTRSPDAEGSTRGTGRVRHDEKITVYVSPDELLALEQARLDLRARHDLAVDRGRIVRAAIAAALSDLDTQGGDSELVRRLTGP